MQASCCDTSTRQPERPRLPPPGLALQLQGSLSGRPLRCSMQLHSWARQQHATVVVCLRTHRLARSEAQKVLQTFTSCQQQMQQQMLLARAMPTTQPAAARSQKSSSAKKRAAPASARRSTHAAHCHPSLCSAQGCTGAVIPHRELDVGTLWRCCQPAVVAASPRRRPGRGHARSRVLPSLPALAGSSGMGCVRIMSLPRHSAAVELLLRTSGLRPG